MRKYKLNQAQNEKIKPMSEINVTPFVDVMLVLLFIYDYCSTNENWCRN